MFTRSTYPPLWVPIHIVGRTLVIFSVSSNWTSLSTDIGLSPSLMSSECRCRSSEAREDRDTGVFVPELAGEPLALNTEGWTSSEPKCTAIKMVLKIGGKLTYQIFISLLWMVIDVQIGVFFNSGNNKLLNLNYLLYKAISIKNALAKMI